METIRVLMYKLFKEVIRLQLSGIVELRLTVLAPLKYYNIDWLENK